MASVDITYKVPDIVGTTNVKVKYRIATDSTWVSYLISAPVANVNTTFNLAGLLDNRIYSIELQNLNGVDNPISLITQGISITDPLPLISPTNTTVGFSFNNLSVDMTSYTVQLTTKADPGIIINSVVISAGVFPNILSGSFTGLSPLTAYNLIFIPVANQYTNSFLYSFTTTTFSCAPSTNIVTTITA